MRIFGPFACASTFAVTTTSAGAIAVAPSPPTSSTDGVNVAPSSTRDEPVDEQPLALADAVLLAADGDDRVAHVRGLLTRKTRADAREPPDCSEHATSKSSAPAGIEVLDPLGHGHVTARHRLGATVSRLRLGRRDRLDGTGDRLGCRFCRARRPRRRRRRTSPSARPWPRSALTRPRSAAVGPGAVAVRHGDDDSSAAGSSSPSPSVVVSAPVGRRAACDGCARRASRAASASSARADRRFAVGRDVRRRRSAASPVDRLVDDRRRGRDRSPGAVRRLSYRRARRPAIAHPATWIVGARRGRGGGVARRRAHVAAARSGVGLDTVDVGLVGVLVVGRGAVRTPSAPTGRFLRRRPPREPRRVFFLTGRHRRGSSPLADSLVVLVVGALGFASSPSSPARRRSSVDLGPVGATASSSVDGLVLDSVGGTVGAPSTGALRRAGARVGFSASLSKVIGAGTCGRSTSVANACPSSTRPIATFAFLPTSFAASATITSIPSSFADAGRRIVEADLDELQLELGALRDRRRRAAGRRACPRRGPRSGRRGRGPSAGTRKKRRLVASSSAASRSPPGAREERQHPRVDGDLVGLDTRARARGASARSLRSTSSPCVASETTIPSPAQVGALARHDLARPVGDVLAGHLDQAERRDLDDVRLRPVALELAAKRLLDRLAVLRVRHVDEVDDDDPADVAQPQLADDLLDGLEVVLDDRVLEPLRRGLRARADETAGVDVDDGERLGVVEDQVAARREVDPAVERRVDLLLDAEALEQRLLAPCSGARARPCAATSSSGSRRCACGCGRCRRGPRRSRLRRGRARSAAAAPPPGRRARAPSRPSRAPGSSSRAAAGRRGRARCPRRRRPRPQCGR